MAVEQGGYRVLSEVSTAELREKGSRFLALAIPVADASQAKVDRQRLAVEHRDASHHCWAQRVGWPPRERWSDAGEPRGTAGEPIARVLRARQLSDTLAVVVRWFGGTKLGKGGLARAYAGALALALEGARLERKYPTVTVRLRMPYDRVGSVKRLIRPGEVEWLAGDYGAVVTASLRVRLDRIEWVRDALADLRVEAEFEREDHS